MSLSNDPGAPVARAYRVTLDISCDHTDPESFVILDALEEYAAEHRFRADNGDINAEFLRELADAADALRERIDAQMITANINEVLR